MVVLRLKAFLVDMFMVMMPIAYLIYFFVPDNYQEICYKYYFPIFYGLVVSLFIYINGQTPGYKAYNLKVIFKRKPKLLLVIIRYFVFLFIFGHFFIFFRKDRTTLHDLVSFSRVVNS